MGNWRGVPTGSGRTGRQKSESIQGPNRITDNGYMEAIQEWAGHWVMGLVQRNNPRTHRFEKINDWTLPFLPTLVPIVSLR